MNQASAPEAVPPVGPWTGHAWDPGSGTRSWVTVACTRCHARLWDEPLGMTVTFPTIDRAREELPAHGWAVTTPPGGAEMVLCPACSARLALSPQSARTTPEMRPAS